MHDAEQHMARTTEHRTIQITVTTLEESCLKSRERNSNFQIKFLTSIDRQGLILVGLAQ
jgi:hypothetical protein